MSRHRTTLVGLEGETIYVEGPDSDADHEIAEYYAQAPERWRGRFFVWYPSALVADPIADRKVFEMHETLTDEGEPLLRWNRVTDPTVLGRIR